jgi:hypothetical protein
VTQDPKNRYSREALGLWLQKRDVFGGVRRDHVGYEPQVLAHHLRARLADGYTLTGQIDEFVGGTRDLSYGLRVVLTLHEPQKIEESYCPNAGVKSKRPSNRTPSAVAE